MNHFIGGRIVKRILAFLFACFITTIGNAGCTPSASTTVSPSVVKIEFNAAAKNYAPTLQAMVDQIPWATKSNISQQDAAKSTTFEVWTDDSSKIFVGSVDRNLHFLFFPIGNATKHEYVLTGIIETSLKQAEIIDGKLRVPVAFGSAEKKR
jgi:hypothetical protein